MSRQTSIPKSKQPVSPAKLVERDITKTVRDFLVHHGWRFIRMQRTVVAGAFQSGEPGIPDYLFIHYFPREKLTYGLILHLWIEFKAPTGRLGPIQKEWHQTEAERGGVVWIVDDFAWFEEEYIKHFGWLHSGDFGRGQLDLLSSLGN